MEHQQPLPVLLKQTCDYILLFHLNYTTSQLVVPEELELQLEAKVQQEQEIAMEIKQHHCVWLDGLLKQRQRFQHHGEVQKRPGEKLQKQMEIEAVMVLDLDVETQALLPDGLLHVEETAQGPFLRSPLTPHDLMGRYFQEQQRRFEADRVLWFLSIGQTRCHRSSQTIPH